MAIKYCSATDRRGSSLKGVIKPAAVLRGTSHCDQFVMMFWAGNRHVSKQ